MLVLLFARCYLPYYDIEKSNSNSLPSPELPAHPGVGWGVVGQAHKWRTGGLGTQKARVP